MTKLMVVIGVTGNQVCANISTATLDGRDIN